MNPLSVVLVLIALAAGSPLGGAAAQGAAESPDNPVTVYTGRGNAPARDDAVVARLLQRAQQQKRIRVIVGLDLTMREEDALSAAEAARQSQALRAMQDAVAARVLGSSSAASVVRFSTIPFLSMFVDADQVRRLLADPSVISIQEDRPVPPGLKRSIPLINANDVWGKGVTGAGQSIAVLDTGVDRNHPMLVNPGVQGRS